MQSTSSAPPRQPRAGVTYWTITSIMPLATAKGGYAYRVTLADAEDGLVAELTAAEIVTYAAARRAIARRYGAWLMVSEVEGRHPPCTWSEVVERALREVAP